MPKQGEEKGLSGVIGKEGSELYLIEKNHMNEVFKYLKSDELTVFGQREKEKKEPEKPGQKKAKPSTIDDAVEEKKNPAKAAGKPAPQEQIQFQKYNPTTVYELKTGINHPVLGKGIVIDVALKGSETRMKVNFLGGVGVRTLVVGSK